MDVNPEAVNKWQPIIEEAESSNQSARSWCKEHGINVDQFYYWRKKLIMSQQEVSTSKNTSGTTGIAEVKLVLRQDQEVTTHALSHPQVMIKVEDFQVYVGTNFDDDVLRRVLGVVKTC